jgi:uncharacterized protein YbbK (DUF523 family)
MKSLPQKHIKALNKKYKNLFLQIKDKRSKKVIFLAHCILNENTRYLGGACRGGCLIEIINQCIENDFGIVQIPCPEQMTWGGVIKRLLLMAYGAKGTILYSCRYIIIPLILIYTKFMSWFISEQIARQIQDYLDSGFLVHGIVGIDGSPTCGVNKTLDFKKSFEVLACINIDSVSIEDANKVVLECLRNGKGFFIQALQKKLNRRGINIRFWAHDLVDELNGDSSNVIL